MKTFNTAGTCRPEEHYMVDITDRLEIIRKMVAKGDYFCINRGRQYGKTTTLEAISTKFSDDFCVFKISFEGVDDKYFESAATTNAAFLKLLRQESRWTPKEVSVKKFLDKVAPRELSAIDDFDFSDVVSELCSISSKPVIVLIDEVDQAGNNDGFIKFLGGLRNMYLKRNTQPTFKSIILAGVYDIKNLKLKIRSEEQHQYNSPWNIAVPFDVDMSLPVDGITNMLAEYKADHNLTFNEKIVAKLLHAYTAGYPFLVSRLCQIIDSEKLPWNKEGVLKAVNVILVERNTLFDNLIKKLDEYPVLKEILKGILFSGNTKSYNPDEKYIQIASMFNYIVNKDGKIAVACRIMEVRLYNLFISEEENFSLYKQGQIDKSQFVKDGIIDMPHLMERFAVHMNQTYKMDHENEFIEDDGRKAFLTYLRPIINGVGYYHIEEETRDHDRMDVVVDYLGKQYVIELKIWRGNAYNERGEEQICRYLEYFDLQKGYLISFCFNKKKKSGLLPPVELKGRTLIEAIV